MTPNMTIIQTYRQSMTQAQETSIQSKYTVISYSLTSVTYKQLDMTKDKFQTSQASYNEHRCIIALTDTTKQNFTGIKLLWLMQI